MGRVPLDGRRRRRRLGRVGRLGRRLDVDDAHGDGHGHGDGQRWARVCQHGAGAGRGGGERERDEHDDADGECGDRHCDDNDVVDDVGWCGEGEGGSGRGVCWGDAGGCCWGACDVVGAGQDRTGQGRGSQDRGLGLFFSFFWLEARLW